MAEAVETERGVNRDQQEAWCNELLSDEQESRRAHRRDGHPCRPDLGARQPGGEIRVLADKHRVVAEMPEAGKKVHRRQREKQPGQIRERHRAVAHPVARRLT